MNGTLVHQIGVAQQFQPDSPPRVEADTTQQVDMGMELINRRAHPETRPPEAQAPKPVEQPRQQVPVILH